MKRTLSALVLIAVFAFGIYSCKKPGDGGTTAGPQQATLDANDQQFNTDQNTTKAESNQADDDINSTISTSSLSGARVEGVANSICGISIDSTSLQQGHKYIIFSYDSTATSCLTPARKRSGKIKFELTSGSKWGDKGAVLTITYMNYKVLYLQSNYSITFNGIKTLTNTNGNNWIGFLFQGTPLIYSERAYNVNVTFNNGSSAVWNSARVTTWTYSAASGSTPAVINFSSNGDTTLNSYSTVDSWGTTRFGKPFTTNYETPILSNTNCGLWRFTSGVFQAHVNGFDFTLNAGVDINGNPVAAGDCPYGFKVSWLVNGNQEYAVFSY